MYKVIVRYLDGRVARLFSAADATKFIGNIFLSGDGHFVKSFDIFNSESGEKICSWVLKRG